MGGSLAKVARREAAGGALSLTARELVEAIRSQDFDSKSGRKPIWWMIRKRLGAFRCSEYETLRDRYRSQGFSLSDSYRLAALDIAADLPTAHELPPDLLASLRPGAGDVDVEAIEAAADLNACVPIPSSPTAVDSKDAVAEEPSHASDQSEPAVTRRGPHTEAVAAGKKAGSSRHTQLSRLLLAVRELAGDSSIGMARAVSWVSANLSTPVELIRAEDVPSLEALSLWEWAKTNQTEYRRLYDSRRIGTAGIVEKADGGFVDDGRAIESIIEQLEQVKDSSNVQV